MISGQWVFAVNKKRGQPQPRPDRRGVFEVVPVPPRGCCEAGKDIPTGQCSRWRFDHTSVHRSPTTAPATTTLPPWHLPSSPRPRAAADARISAKGANRRWLCWIYDKRSSCYRLALSHVHSPNSGKAPVRYRDRRISFLQ